MRWTHFSPFMASHFDGQVSEDGEFNICEPKRLLLEYSTVYWVYKSRCHSPRWHGPPALIMPRCCHSSCCCRLSQKERSHYCPHTTTTVRCIECSILHCPFLYLCRKASPKLKEPVLPPFHLLAHIIETVLLQHDCSQEDPCEQ